MRSLAQMAVPGGVAGWGFFTYDRPMGSTGMHCFGDTDIELTGAQVNTVAVVLGLGLDTIPIDSLTGVLQDLYVNKGDPTGKARWKPLRMGKQGFELHIGDRTLLTQPLDITSKGFENTLAVRWEDYRQHKIAGTPLERLRKWNGRDMQTFYGRMGDDLMQFLVPPEHQADGWQKPATTITDNFNRANGELGANWTDDEGDADVVSNQYNPTTSQVVSRYSGTSLSSDDHYTQIKVATYVSNVSGPIQRKTASGTLTYYAAVVIATTDLRSYKRIGGTITNLQTDSFTFVNGDIIKGEVNDSTLKKFQNGGQIGTNLTDTSITGNLQCGIVANRGDTFLDDFECADLAAAAAAQFIMID